MLSFAPNPIASWDYRPTISSPLSSSPIRASSPLSTIDSNTVSHRQTQSSPIQPLKFKYASRPTRPNPVVRRREETQEKRRNQFLQNVRSKAEDKAWKRRDIEGQFLKQSLLASVGQLSYDAPAFSETDIEDAMAHELEQSQVPQEDDEMMEGPPEEDDELEAMVASYEQQQDKPSTHSTWAPSPAWSDDGYDELFEELMEHENQVQQQPHQSYASISWSQGDSMDEDGRMGGMSVD